MNDDKFLWDQFARLGEMMGDGLHHESDGKWISKEYRRLMLILCPDIKQQMSEQRKIKNRKVDEKVSERLSVLKCLKDDCTGVLRQSRSGSKVVYCSCGARYKFAKK